MSRISGRKCGNRFDSDSFSQKTGANNDKTRGNSYAGMDFWFLWKR